MFKNILVLLAMITVVASISTGSNNDDAIKRRYESPKEVIDALNKIIKQTEEIKSKIRIKNDKQGRA